jgi:hypothetical protein
MKRLAPLWVNREVLDSISRHTALVFPAEEPGMFPSG